MAEIIYVARFTEKSGFPVEKEYKTREGQREPSRGQKRNGVLTGSLQLSRFLMQTTTDLIWSLNRLETR